MNDGATYPNSAGGADLDPDIRRFIRAVTEGYARHPRLDQVPAAQARRVVEAVRAPWAAGGPQMARTTELEVPFDGTAIRVRLHNPTPPAPKPALIYLHGGGWTYFSLDTHDRLMREYAARADVVVIGVDYALSPEARFPTALEQVVHVVRWVKEHAASLGVDAARLALGGDSAGGNLTLAACLSLRDAGQGGVVRAMVLNYAALDRECSAESHRRFGGEGYMLASDEMQTFWGNYAGDATASDNPLIYPNRAQVHELPPAYLAIAECDILAQQNLEMAAKLRAASVPVRAVVYQGASHSFLEAVSIARVSDRALEETARWLRQTLKPERAL